MAFEIYVSDPRLEKPMRVSSYPDPQQAKVEMANMKRHSPNQEFYLKDTETGKIVG